VIRYLERALSEEYAGHQAAYADGLAALDRRAQAAHGQNFGALAPELQDAALAELEGSEFFELIRTHAIEGMFGDPRWGGNSDFAGWDLIGYAGLRRAWSAAEQQLDVVLSPVHRGADDLGGERL
jgi:gluconate 2-dehydrogenase gamma chain